MPRPSAIPKLPEVSEEMRRTSLLLAGELAAWPGVTQRAMFGMRAFYRGDAVFAMLPDKRALRNSRAIAYKLPSAASKAEGDKWKLFELKNERDIAGALACLERAYKKAAHRLAHK